MNINYIAHAQEKQNIAQSINWLDVININENHNISEQYEDICQKHSLSRKWILMINPADNSLEQLSNSNRIDSSKILKVNTNKTKIALKNIESALCNGNCSAVILCNPTLKNEELAQLNSSAIKGKTACIVLKNNTQLH